MIMKNAIISFVFAVGILLTSCSASREVRVTERDEDNGVVVKRERRIDDDGVVIKKSRREKDILTDDDNRETRIKVRKERRERDRDKDRDEPAIIIERDR